MALISISSQSWADKSPQVQIVRISNAHEITECPGD
jgi:hypothetical protein